MGKRLSEEENYQLRKKHSDEQRKRIMLSVDTFPYLMLDVADPRRAKPECCAMDGKALRYDHPYWTDHYPPCTKTCLCGVIQYSEKMLLKHGIPIVDGGN